MNVFHRIGYDLHVQYVVFTCTLRNCIEITLKFDRDTGHVRDLFFCFQARCHS